MSNTARIFTLGRHSASTLIHIASQLKIVGSEVGDFRGMIFREASKNIPSSVVSCDLIFGGSIFDFENHDMKHPRVSNKHLKTEDHFVDVFSILYNLPILRDCIEKRESYSILSKPFDLGGHMRYVRFFISSGEPEAHLLSPEKIKEFSITTDWVLAYPA